MSIISIQGPRFQFVVYLILFLSPILYTVAIFNLLSLEPSIQYISTRSYSRDSYRFSTSFRCSCAASSLLFIKIEKDAYIGGDYGFCHLERFSLFSSSELAAKPQILGIVAVFLAVVGALQQSFQNQNKSQLLVRPCLCRSLLYRPFLLYSFP